MITATTTTTAITMDVTSEVARDLVRGQETAVVLETMAITPATGTETDGQDHRAISIPTIAATATTTTMAITAKAVQMIMAIIPNIAATATATGTMQTRIEGTESEVENIATMTIIAETIIIETWTTTHDEATEEVRDNEVCLRCRGIMVMITVILLHILNHWALH